MQQHLEVAKRTKIIELLHVVVFFVNLNISIGRNHAYFAQVKFRLIELPLNLL